MGSASRAALAAARKALEDGSAPADVATGEGIFQAAALIARSAHLRAVLSDPAAEAGAKRELVARLFGGQLPPTALEVLAAVAAGRWSGHRELLSALDELGIRAVAASAGPGARIEDEIFAFGRLVAQNPSLELALSSGLATSAAKTSLVSSLLADRVTPQTLAIVSHVAVETRDESVREALARAAEIVADQAGTAIATVTSAHPLGASQVERLRERLSARYGGKFKIDQVIDPSVVGGLRVQIGDVVIDGSVASRINDVKLRLAS